MQALPVTEISPEGEVFHSVDHTARTNIITPTKTLRGEVVIIIFIIIIVMMIIIITIIIIVIITFINYYIIYYY